MKRRALFFFLLVLLAGCAATQNMPQMTYMMNSASKIQYYQDQKNIMKRIVCVLIEHNLSVSLTIGRRINKEGKIFKLRAV